MRCSCINPITQRKRTCFEWRVMEDFRFGISSPCVTAWKRRFYLPCREAVNVPIYEQTYRPKPRGTARSRWWTVAAQELRVARTSPLFRRLFLLSMLPFMLYVFVLIVVDLMTANPRIAAVVPGSPHRQYRRVVLPDIHLAHASLCLLVSLYRRRLDLQRLSKQLARSIFREAALAFRLLLRANSRPCAACRCF